ncbi:alpha/beta fold hydrolase [Rubrobacter marinus]|uniref:Alpha/beta fold hydrolase n=1 Tax=Rubrobacter marinus TaxID=2653852 RepID=A0A6G8PWH0_9ACTN|nr:alpha/beta fold hydrolase [Rubrobacter marinus]QIN78558.1 alpha/beta fold hydrolase [Rubrobacter marinus]
MSTFVLVHGAWHGAWCWEKVTPLLEDAGHEVVVPDLPGHGEDATSVSELSMQDYADRVVRVLDEQPEPVVLVGHSMGGLVISLAAEARPDRVKKLVYLTGFLLEDGKTLLSVAENDGEAIVLPNLVPNEDGSAFTVNNIKEVFYGDCSHDDVARAQTRLVPEPAFAFGTPVAVTEGNFGRVPRAYVECVGDRAIGISAQRGMREKLPCETVVSMGTSHSPFFSAPEELAGHLVALA